jgi:hypothetical protein
MLINEEKNPEKLGRFLGDLFRKQLVPKKIFSHTVYTAAREKK